MSLFAPIDRVATAANARELLIKDLPHIMARAGRPLADLTGIDYSSSTGGSSGSPKNATEISLVNHLNDRELYERLFDCIQHAVGVMADSEFYHFHKTIIVECYIERKPDKLVAPRLGWEVDSLAPHKVDALCEFAENYDFSKGLYGLKELPELTVFYQETPIQLLG